MSEGPPDDDEGRSGAELSREAPDELPVGPAVPAIGDISVPLDPESAADALLGQDVPEAGNAAD